VKCVYFIEICLVVKFDWDCYKIEVAIVLTAPVETYFVTPPKLLSTTKAVTLSFISPDFSHFTGVYNQTIEVQHKLRLQLTI